ncbi:hypothetical protein [Vibrio furnissii]|uniref:hypothetical protein n=1 Tax=Vibrio furnissii TaxID=29494 RepID=UPI0037520BD2
MDSDQAVETPKRIVWKTAIRRHAEHFEKVLASGEAVEKHFSLDYLEKISSKSERFYSLSNKLSLIHLSLMVILYILQTNPKMEFEFGGYSIKNIGSYREFILLIAAAIAPVIAMQTAYKSYLDALIDKLIERGVQDENLRKFYRYAWLDRYFDSIAYTNREDNFTNHGATGVIVLSFVVVVLVIVLIYMIATTILQFNVIYDILNNPSSPSVVNTFIVIISITLILVSILINVLRLPMPCIDLTYYEKLNKINEIAPGKYKSIIDELNRRDDRKEKFKVFVTVSIFYTIFYYNFIWFGVEGRNLIINILELVISIGVSYFSSTTIYIAVKQYINTSYYKKYIIEENDYNKFRNKKLIVTIFRYSIPIVITWISCTFIYN